MAKYSYTYSGSNAAFVFAGVATLPTGIAVLLEADQHKALQKNKFAKHLIDAGELAIEEVAEVGDSKPASGRGKGAQSGKTDDGKGKDLFKPEVIKGFDGVDATDYHPPKNEINASNWKEYHIGECFNVRQEGDFLVGDLIIKDQNSINAIQNNERVEISLGYAADLVLEQGTAPDGTPYQAKFINFKGNHVALVKYGRCGGDCRVGDQNPNPKEGKTMEVVVNGIRFDIGDNKPLADALKIQQDQLENLKAAKLKVGDKQFAIGDELPAVQAVVDTLQTENAQLKQKVGDLEKNQITPEKLDQVVAERASVVADAVALVPGIKTEGCSCEQIKRDVIAAKAGDTLVTAVLGGVAVGDAKPEQIDTVFRALSAVKSTTPGNAVGDALHQQQQQQNQGQDPKENKGYDKSAAYKTI